MTSFRKMSSLSTVFYNYPIFLFALLIFVGYACQLQDEIISTNRADRLSFSVDTVKFDTLLTKEKSITKRLRVYNRSRNALIVNNIRLGKSNQSVFNLVINGKATNETSNLRILGGDSILILVTTQLPEQNKNLPTLVRDSILFETNSNQQHVKLWAWGQDVTRISKSRLSSPTTWTNAQPYFVKDTLWIATGGVLTIEAGTTVYVAPEAMVLVQGQLIVKGNAENPVVFTGTRNDKGFEDLSGQWVGIVFSQDSKGAILDYAHVKNADFGLYIGIPDKDTVPDVIVRNSIIANMRATGIVAFNSDILLQNTLITNCLERIFDAQYGGNYTLQHCTFANYRGIIQKQPSLRLQNFYAYTRNGVQVTDLAPLQVRMDNSILWGDLEEEVEITNQTAEPVRLLFRNNILRTAQPNTNGTNNQTGNTFNFPLFKNIGKDDFTLQEKSPAINKGLPIGIAKDLNDKIRTNPPDIGAYEF